MEGIKRLGIEAPQAQCEQLLTYLTILKQWNAKINLTAIQDDRGIIIRHFLDSLAALPAIDMTVDHRVMDIGSGAGFPGLPIKIFRPAIFITLVEPIKKKAAFLHTVCGRLQLDHVEVLAERLEVIASRSARREGYDLLMLRALRPARILGQAVSLLRFGGRVILWVAKGAEETLLKEIGKVTSWGPVRVVPYRLPFEEIERELIILTKSQAS